MTAQSPINRTRRHRILWIAGFVAVACAYFVVFLMVRDEPPVLHLKAVARSVLPLAFATWGVRILLRAWVLPLQGIGMWLSHAGLALAFSFFWLWLITVAAGLFEASSATRFSVVPFFVGPAEAWQLLQGLFAYVAIAALTVLEHRPAGALIIVDNSSPEFRERFLLRNGENVLPLAAADIVSITGADDYAQVVTTSGRELVSTTLSEFEKVLDPVRFLRVHRSAIANLDHLERAEPVGSGRMVLRMQAGPDVPVSRAGARLLRERLL